MSDKSKTPSNSTKERNVSGKFIYNRLDNQILGTHSSCQKEVQAIKEETDQIPDRKPSFKGSRTSQFKKTHSQNLSSESSISTIQNLSIKKLKQMPLSHFSPNKQHKRDYR